MVKGMDTEHVSLIISVIGGAATILTAVAGVAWWLRGFVMRIEHKLDTLLRRTGNVDP